MSVPQSLLKRRSVVLSISAAAIIAVGAFTGASLKQGAQYQARVEGVKQQSLDNRIADLKGYRASLELQKKGLTEKLATVREKLEQQNSS